MHLKKRYFFDAYIFVLLPHSYSEITFSKFMFKKIHVIITFSKKNYNKEKHKSLLEWINLKKGRERKKIKRSKLKVMEDFVKLKF